jgi:hypothetical protein
MSPKWALRDGVERKGNETPLRAFKGKIDAELAFSQV